MRVQVFLIARKKVKIFERLQKRLKTDTVYFVFLQLFPKK